MPTSTKRKIATPPFMQGGKMISDSIIRNQQGYPLDEAGNIDLAQVKKETLAYQRAVQNKFKQTNYTPPKKKRRP